MPETTISANVIWMKSYYKVQDRYFYSIEINASLSFNMPNCVLSSLIIFILYVYFIVVSKQIKKTWKSYSDATSFGNCI